MGQLRRGGLPCILPGSRLAVESKHAGSWPGPLLHQYRLLVLTGAKNTQRQLVAESIYQHVWQDGWSAVPVIDDPLRSARLVWNSQAVYR